MPTIQKPQLNDVSFPWHQQSDRFQEELDSQSAEILQRSGFNREFANPGDVPNINAETEGTAFILEPSGILSQAAAIMDAGYKPADKVIATLKAIKKDPSLIQWRCRVRGVGHGGLELSTRRREARDVLV
jgi:hypothetical protein